MLERQVISLMSRLNVASAEIAERGLAKAAVDVTGFGLLGHLGAKRVRVAKIVATAAGNKSTRVWGCGGN